MDLLDKIKIDSEKNTNKEYVSLKTTTELVESLVDAHPKWEYLKKYYDVVDDPTKDKYFQIFVSFVNAIFTQERVWFNMGGDSFKENVFKNDKNWKNIDNTKCASDAWTKFRNYIRTNNIAICHNESKDHRRSTDGRPFYYELIDPSLLAYITVDPEAQRKETLDFLNGKEKQSDTGSDTPSDTGSDTPSDTHSVIDIDTGIDVEEQKQIASQRTNKKMDVETFFRTNLEQVPKEINSGKEEMYSLADLAVNNVEFDPDSASDNRRLVKYLKQKLGHKKDGYAKVLVDAFCDGFKDILAMKEAEGFEYKEPEPISMKAVKMEIDKEKRNQEKIGAMLKVHFGKENVEQLKEQLKNETDEMERLRIEHEIRIWGG